jgi:hypothetical protein
VGLWVSIRGSGRYDHFPFCFQEKGIQNRVLFGKLELKHSALPGFTLGTFSRGEEVIQKEAIVHLLSNVVATFYHTKGGWQ